MNCLGISLFIVITNKDSTLKEVKMCYDQLTCQTGSLLNEERAGRKKRRDYFSLRQFFLFPSSWGQSLPAEACLHTISLGIVNAWFLPEKFSLFHAPLLVHCSVVCFILLFFQPILFSLMRGCVAPRLVKWRGKNHNSKRTVSDEGVWCGDEAGPLANETSLFQNTHKSEYFK